MLLGGSTAAATIGRLIGSLRFEGIVGADPFELLLWLLVVVVCSAAGYAMASNLAEKAFKAERMRWMRMLILIAVIGSAWGVVTGAAGGFFIFGLGAVVGLALLWPIGLVGFAMFASLHRLLERGGMIDMRHLLPIACGIPAIMTALILGL
jgi:hypothetical protein